MLQVSVSGILSGVNYGGITEMIDPTSGNFVVSVSGEHLTWSGSYGVSGIRYGALSLLDLSGNVLADIQNQHTSGSHDYSSTIGSIEQTVSADSDVWMMRIYRISDTVKAQYKEVSAWVDINEQITANELVAVRLMVENEYTDTTHRTRFSDLLVSEDTPDP